MGDKPSQGWPYPKDQLEFRSKVQETSFSSRGGETMANKSKALALSRLIAAVLLPAMLAAMASAQSQGKPNAAGSGPPTQGSGTKPSLSRNRLLSSRTAASQRAARYFDAIKDDPSQLLAFLKAMPKGADLHNHLSGSVYAEDYIKLAAANHLCVNQADKALTPPPCAAGQRIDEAIRANSALYDKLIDAWSMRNPQLSGESGHDHFFAAFGKFGAAINDNTIGDMLAAALNQAASNRVGYTEFMFTPNSANIRKLAAGRWNDDFDVMSKSINDA